MPETPILIENLHKAFSKRPVLESISLALSPGSVFGLVGLNGAGKTTLIRCMLGLLKPDAGRISIFGLDPWKHDPRLYREIGVIMENDGFSGNLNFMENLRFFAAAKGVGSDDLGLYLRDHWAGVEIATSKKKVKLFSRGQKMQAAVCRAFAGWPRLCLFDEPLVGLDIDAYDHFCMLVRAARDRGSTVFISSHQLEAVEDLCDTIGLLHNRTLRVFPKSEAIGREIWTIRTDDGTAPGEIIGRHGGAGIVRRQEAWNFTIDNAGDAIPAIVGDLVIAGCKVREVRCEKNDLRESIRSIYQGG